MPLMFISAVAGGMQMQVCEEKSLLWTKPSLPEFLQVGAGGAKTNKSIFVLFEIQEPFLESNPSFLSLTQQVGGLIVSPAMWLQSKNNKCLCSPFLQEFVPIIRGDSSDTTISQHKHMLNPFCVTVIVHLGQETQDTESRWKGQTQNVHEGVNFGIEHSCPYLCISSLVLLSAYQSLIFGWAPKLYYVQPASTYVKTSNELCRVLKQIEMWPEISVACWHVWLNTTREQSREFQGGNGLMRQNRCSHCKSARFNLFQRLQNAD